MTELQTVTFQAKTTNSTPPPLPYNIEQGLRGEVGTIRLPSELSKNSNLLGSFITALNFIGVIWLLWQTPIIAGILAICIAGISASLAGLFHGIPYLSVRRSEWTQTNWTLLHLCFAVSLATSAAITWALISHPPTFAVNTLFPHSKGESKVERIQRELAIATKDCAAYGNPYHQHDCAWRDGLRADLATAKRDAAPPQEPSDAEDDFTRKLLTYGFALAVLAGVHGIAAYGGPFSSETGNAIWREPHTGYPPGLIAYPKPPEDPEATLKKKGFDHWLKNNITLSGDGVLPVDAIYDDYKKALGKHVIPPPAYNLSEFKTAFRSAAGKEPVEIKGVPSYQGVSFAGGGLL